MTQRTNASARLVMKSSVVNSLTIAALEKEELFNEVSISKTVPSEKYIPDICKHNPRQNGILASLSAIDYERLLPHLELIPMLSGMTLGEAGQKMQYVYFPTSGIVSLLSDTKDGTSVETAVVGHEGLVGVTLFMGEGSSQSRARVKSDGYGYRLSVRVLREEFGRGGALQSSLLRYTHALLTQTSQTAVCNRHHNITQQLCRSILLSVDRLPTNELRTTQELISLMLGVRRESITQSVEILQKEGLISSRRGRIAVTDRAGLEHRVCECYATVKKVYDVLLPAKNTA